MANGKSTTGALAERKALPVASIVPQSVNELIQLADILYKGGLGQKAGASRPEAVAAIIVTGLEIGLKPGQALSSIYLQGGRATLYGPMPLAMVRASGLLESFEEKIEGQGEDRACVCTAKRKGDPSYRTERYSIADARRAKLLERSKGTGAWDTVPDRMLRFRARTPVLQDLFGDILAGFDLTDEREVAEQPADSSSSATLPPTTVTTITTISTDGPPATPVNLPPTDAHGELMIDDAQLAEVKRLMPTYCKVYGPQGGTDEQLAAFWREWIRKAYGVESAKMLTASQAESLLVILRDCAASPTAGLFVPPTDQQAKPQQQQQQPTPTAA